MQDDTAPEAWAAYWARLRAMTPAERIAVAIELSELSDQMVRAGVRLRHPEAGPEEFRYWVMRAKYGKELADRVFGRQAKGAGA